MRNAHEEVLEGFAGAELARVAVVRTGKLAFVKVSGRGSTLFAVPVPSARGAAILLFAAKVRSRKSRWWTPTLALAGSPLRSLIERLEALAEGGGRAFTFRSRKSGLFVSVRRRGSGYALLLGKGEKVYAAIEARGGDLAKLASALREVLERGPTELPLPLTWRDKERVFGPHA